jgi:hypothetical protein
MRVLGVLTGRGAFLLHRSSEGERQRIWGASELATFVGEWPRGPIMSEDASVRWIGISRSSRDDQVAIRPKVASRPAAARTPKFSLALAFRSFDLPVKNLGIPPGVGIPVRSC